MAKGEERSAGATPDGPTVFVCSCDNTVPLDVGAIQRGLPSLTIKAAEQLCGAEREQFRNLAAAGSTVIVGCTQEAPLFSRLVNEDGGDAPLSFVNIRESAGWSDQGGNAAPKMAALLAVRQAADPPAPMITFESHGAILIYGNEEAVLEAAALLKDHLDVTAMIKEPAACSPSRVNEYPIVKGTIRSATGHLGSFTLSIDGFATAVPSSRGTLAFGSPKNGAVLHCDIVLDLSGETPLFGAFELRDGYLRAGPRDEAAMLRAVIKARDLIGTFDKPRYVELKSNLCAHARSGKVGCKRCLDLCPAGAITSGGDYVAVDPMICAGCGQCATVCPTGAASYTLPPADSLMRRLRMMLGTYRTVGGVSPVILFHDDYHGWPLIEALARHGSGLPANVLPFAVNEVTQIGLETVVVAFAFGASDIRFLVRHRPRYSIDGLFKTIGLSERILNALGFGSVQTIETDDPDSLKVHLESILPHAAAPKPARFNPVGEKREVLRVALRELHAVAPTPTDVITLPPDAPFGKIEVDVAGCTLCLSCVSVCPTGALRDDPEFPRLRFVEDACVQCGLCKATCPESVITLRPQLDFHAATAVPITLKEEEPFHCIRCSKPFGVKSSIERVIGKLAGQHWMYRQDPARLNLLRMCDDCRIGAITEDEFDPHGAPARTVVRTTDDYLRERKADRRPEIRSESKSARDPD